MLHRFIGPRQLQFLKEMIVAASFFEVFSKDLSLHESITDDGNLSRFQVILLSYLMISKAEDKLDALQRK